MNSASQERAAGPAGTPARRRAVWALCLASVAGLLGYALTSRPPSTASTSTPARSASRSARFYLGIGVAALVGLATARRALGQRIAAGLMLVSAVGGIVTAGRQVWLQHLPPDLVPRLRTGSPVLARQQPLVSRR